jgi:hypothetical protein
LLVEPDVWLVLGHQLPAAIRVRRLEARERRLGLAVLGRMRMVQFMVQEQAVELK